MDYGQNTQPTPSTGSREQPVSFTSGIGMTPENENPLDPTFNLNKSDFNMKQNYSEVGNVALNSAKNGPNSQIANKPLTPESINLPFPTSEQVPNSAPNLSRNPVYDPYADTKTEEETKLGEITDLNTPPLVNNVQSTTEEDRVSEDTNSTKHFIGEKISKEDFEYLKSLENKLSQDDDAEDFYDTIQNIRLEKNNGVAQKEKA